MFAYLSKASALAAPSAAKRTAGVNFSPKHRSIKRGIIDAESDVGDTLSIAFCTLIETSLQLFDAFRRDRRQQLILVFKMPKGRPVRDLDAARDGAQR